MILNKVARLSLPTCYIVCLSTVVWAFVSPVLAQTPAPTIEWSPWEPLGSCGGVHYQISITKDDGRNEFQVRLKAVNSTAHLVATRFEAALTSSAGEKQYRQGGSKINAGQEARGSSFDLGQPFQTPVNMPLPIHIKSLVATVVETANVEKLPAYASPSTYLNDFRDFPKETCKNFVHDFGDSILPRFMQLTNTCYQALPSWTSSCQDAVDEIISYANTAPQSEIACLKEWRIFQKCYESYAYDPNPRPRPQCVERIPHCNLR